MTRPFASVERSDGNAGGDEDDVSGKEDQRVRKKSFHVWLASATLLRTTMRLTNKSKVKGLARFSIGTFSISCAAWFRAPALKVE
jgi:hypothetical protein